MTEVKREHREAALALLYRAPVSSEREWADTGVEPEESHEGISRAVRVAWALAGAEQRGAERERAAVVKYLREDGFYPSMMDDIGSGQHRKGEE